MMCEHSDSVIGEGITVTDQIRRGIEFFSAARAEILDPASPTNSGDAAAAMGKLTHCASLPFRGLQNLSAATNGFSSTWVKQIHLWMKPAQLILALNGWLRT
jgi:hypothetical protein